MNDSDDTVRASRSKLVTRLFIALGVIVVIAIALLAAVQTVFGGSKDEQSMFGLTNQVPAGVTITYEEQVAIWEEMVDELQRLTADAVPGSYWSASDRENWRRIEACTPTIESDKAAKGYSPAYWAVFRDGRDVLQEVNEQFEGLLKETATKFGWSLYSRLGETTEIWSIPEQPETSLKIYTHDNRVVFGINQGCLLSNTA